MKSAADLAASAASSGRLQTSKAQAAAAYTPLKLTSKQKALIQQTAAKSAAINEALPYAPKQAGFVNLIAKPLLQHSDDVTTALRAAQGSTSPDDSTPTRPTGFKLVTPTIKAPPKRSLFGQVTDIVRQAPSGAVHLAGEVGQAAIGAAHVPQDAVSAGLNAAGINTDKLGFDVPGLGRQGLSKQSNNALETEIKQVAHNPTSLANYQNAVATTTRHYMPVANELAKSFQATAHDVRHPTEYWRAYQDGHLVAKAVNDLANASLVGGVVAKVFGAGGAAAASAAEAADAAGNTSRAARFTKLAERAQKASDVTHSAATLGAQAGNAPAEVYTKGAELGVKAIKKLAPNLVDSSAVGAVKDAAMQIVPSLNPDVRKVRRMQNDARGELSQKQEQLFHDEMVPVAKIGSHNPDLLSAAPLVRQGMGPVLDEIRRTAPGFADQIINRSNEALNREEAYQFSPEAARLAAELHAGNLPPEEAAQLQAILDATSTRDSTGAFRQDTAAGRRTQAYVDQGGQRVAQWGDQPLQSVIDEARKPFEQKLIKADKSLQTMKRIKDRAQNTTAALGGPDEISGLAGTRAVKAGEALQRATHANRAVENQTAFVNRLKAKLDQATAAAAKSPEAMPSRFRTTRAITNDLVQGAKAEMAHQVAQGASLADVAPLQQVVDHLSNLSLPQMKDMGIDPEHLIGGDLTRAGKGQGVKRGLLPKSIKEQATYQRETSMVPMNALDQSRMENRALKDQARNAAAQKFVAEQGVKADSVLGAGHGLAGPDLVAAMAQHDRVPYSPGQRYKEMDPSLVNNDTAFIPAAVHHELTKDSFRDPNVVMKALKSANKSWKTTVLPASAHWHVFASAGHMANAMAMGGVDPINFFSKMRDGIKLLHDQNVTTNTGETVSAADLARTRGQGLSHEVATGLSGADTKAGLPTRAVRKLVGNSDTVTPGIVTRAATKSYAMHSFIDNMTRNMLYLAKRDQGLSHEAALKVGIDALGDYSNMSPFEQNYVKEVIPFYPWIKQMTKVAVKLPAYHPMRALWLGHLANTFGDDQTDLPDFAKGGLKLGNGSILPIGKLNPFADVMGTGGAGLAADVGKAISPAIKIPVAAATGINLNRGPLQLTRPAGSGNTTDTGLPGATPLWNRPGELANYAASLSPMTSTLRDLIGGAKARYDTGAPYAVKDAGGHEAPIPTGNPLVRFLGFPSPITKDEIQKAEDTKNSRLEKFHNPGNYVTIKRVAPSTPAGIMTAQLVAQGYTKAQADAAVKVLHLDAKFPEATKIADKAQAARDARDFPGKTPAQIKAIRAAEQQALDRAQYPGKTPAQIAVLKAQAQLAAATAPAKTAKSKKKNLPVISIGK